MMMMIKSALILLLASVLPAQVYAGVEDLFCCLCPGCAPAHSNSYEFYVNEPSVSSDVISCPQLDFDMATALTPGSGGCNAVINRNRPCCCSATPASQCTSAPGGAPETPPEVHFPQGQHPWCDLCANGQYPDNPYNIATIAGMPGNPTCSDLYWMGRSGNLPPGVCFPAQMFLEESCGCTSQGPAQPSPSPPSPSAPSPPSPSAPSGVTTLPKNPNHTSKDNLKIGVVGMATDHSM